MALTPEQWDQKQAERKCAICGENTGSIAFFNKGKAYHIGCIFASYEDLLVVMADAQETVDSFLIGKILPEHRTEELERITGRMAQAITEARS